MHRPRRVMPNFSLRIRLACWVQASPTLQYYSNTCLMSVYGTVTRRKSRTFSTPNEPRISELAALLEPLDPFLCRSVVRERRKMVLTRFETSRKCVYMYNSKFTPPMRLSLGCWNTNSCIRVDNIFEYVGIKTAGGEMTREMEAWGSNKSLS